MFRMFLTNQLITKKTSPNKLFTCRFFSSEQNKMSYLSPQLIHFSQPTLSQYFSNGKRLMDLADKIRAQTIKPEELPRIRIVEQEGKYFTLDNRRLAVYKLLRLEQIPVQMVSLDDQEIAKCFAQRFDPIKQGRFSIVDTTKERQDILHELREAGLINGIGIRHKP